MNKEITKGHCRYWRTIHQRNAIFRNEKRIVFKPGNFNIEKPYKTKCNKIQDLVTVFIKGRWRWILPYCVFAYVSNWFVFAIIWWCILYVHGDLNLEHLPSESNTTEWIPCVRGIHNFTSIFLFSVEVHTTVGYGKRAVTQECVSAILTMCIESIIGKITQSLIIGIVFAKFTKPKNRAHTLIFSKNIIVNLRNANLCLMFRVGNVRKSRIIGSTVCAYLIKFETGNGDLLNYEQVELKLDIDSNATTLVFPLTALHVINKSSPFYNISAYDILNSNIEILVVFEGIIESTGRIVQAKSSYTNCDIIWGRRFVNSVSYKNNQGGYIIDYAKFDKIYRINTPVSTSRELQKYYEARKVFKNNSKYLTNLLPRQN